MAARPTLAIADKNPVIRTGLVDIISRDGRFDDRGDGADRRRLPRLSAEQTVDIARHRLVASPT